jgi:hypothetical protein
MSGYIKIKTGASSDTGSASGSLTIETGQASRGTGGAIILSVGPAGVEAIVVDTITIQPEIVPPSPTPGGAVIITAGSTLATGSIGGSVSITAGEGKSEDATDGGNGGVVTIMGGEGKGMSATDNGGDCMLSGKCLHMILLLLDVHKQSLQCSRWISSSWKRRSDRGGERSRDGDVERRDRDSKCERWHCGRERCIELQLWYNVVWQ